MNIDPATNVLIVGAGPVGLATAIQAKIRNSKLRITLLDKNETYVRTQKLRLRADSFSKMPDDPELQRIVKKFLSKKLVPIQEIESDLKGLAKKIGIQFAQQYVNDETFDATLARFPNAGCVIGADGARSFVRKRVFGEAFKMNQSVEYIVQVKYSTKEETERLTSIETSWGVRRARTLVEESVGGDGRKEVSLRFFVNEKTFNKIREAKAKDPWSVSDPRVPKSLRKKIDDWIRVRGRVHIEEVVDKPTLTGIELKIYSAKRVMKEVDGRIYCLVGDAAGGVPFFRSINKGFKESSELSQALASAGPIAPAEGLHDVWIKKKFKRYQERAKSIAFWENLAAKVKTFFIDAVIKGIKFFRLVTPAFIADWAKEKQLYWQEKKEKWFTAVHLRKKNLRTLGLS